MFLDIPSHPNPDTRALLQHYDARLVLGKRMIWDAIARSADKHHDPRVIALSQHWFNVLVELTREVRALEGGPT